MEVEKDVTDPPPINVDEITENGVEDNEVSEDSDSDEEVDERYFLTVDQREKLNMKKDTYKAMRDVFRKLDEDGSGSLELTELETAMKSMGVEYSDKDMENLIKQMDADGNGSVEFNEFCKVVTEKMKMYDPEKDLKEAFEVFDINGDGKVTSDEIQTVVESFGGKMSTEEIDSMLKEADENNDGYIDYAGKDVCDLLANSVGPDQTARKRRLVWAHAGRIGQKIPEDMFSRDAAQMGYTVQDFSNEFVRIWMGETSIDSDKNAADSANNVKSGEAGNTDDNQIERLSVPE